MSNFVTYTFYLDNGGETVENVSPEFDTFIDLDSSILNNEIRQVEANTHPNIRSLAGGFYYFQIDWDTFSGKSYLVKIDCGDENDFVNPAQRFIIMKLERNDNLSNVVERIETSSNSVVEANTELTKYLKRLLEIEQGTWRIEFEDGQYRLNLYPTNDGSGTPLYETTLDVNDSFSSHILTDEEGIASATNIFNRVVRTIEPLDSQE